MRRTTVLAAYAIATAVACLIWSAHAAFAGARPKLIVIVAHSVVLRDISAANLPNFRWLLENGAVGIMTTRAAPEPSDDESETGTEGACLTLGAGCRATGGKAGRQAYNVEEIVRGEPAGAVYERRNLRRPSPPSVVHLGVNRMKAENAKLPYDADVGLLGASLHSAGLLTACLGNSDTDCDLHRESVMICMDANGLVDMGDVSGRMTRLNVEAPYGVETDQRALMAEFDKLIERADLIVVDTGDIARAGWYADKCSTSQAKLIRERALRQVDQLLAKILHRVDLRNSRVVVVSPSASKSEANGDEKLTPIVIAGAGISPGLLTSPSTRRMGLVTNTDMAPTALAYFNLETPKSVAGRPMRVSPRANALLELVVLERRMSMQNERLVLMRTFAVILTIIVGLGTLTISRSRISAQLALIPPAIMLSAVISPAFGSYSLAVTAGIIMGMTVAALVVFRALRVDAVQALLWMSVGLCAALAVDIARGGVWLANSPMSYSAAEGSRFYGLGNELMGSFIGAACVVALGIFQPGPKATATGRRLKVGLYIVCFGTLVMFVGSPSLGANAGGAIAALVTAVAAIAALRTKPMSFRQCLLGVACLAAVFGLIMGLDTLRQTSGQSHIGRALALMTGGGLPQIWLIIERKIAMNLLLLQTSCWSRLLLVCAAALTVIRIRYGFESRTPWVQPAIRVICVGAVAAFLFNDSGVVAAATCLIYAWSLALIAGSRPTTATD